MINYYIEKKDYINCINYEIKLTMSKKHVNKSIWLKNYIINCIYIVIYKFIQIMFFKLIIQLVPSKTPLSINAEYTFFFFFLVSVLLKI